MPMPEFPGRYRFVGETVPITTKGLTWTPFAVGNRVPGSAGSKMVATLRAAGLDLSHEHASYLTQEHIHILQAVLHTTEDSERGAGYGDLLEAVIKYGKVLVMLEPE